MCVCARACEKVGSHFQIPHFPTSRRSSPPLHHPSPFRVYKHTLARMYLQGGRTLLPLAAASAAMPHTRTHDARTHCGRTAGRVSSWRPRTATRRWCGCCWSGGPRSTRRTRFVSSARRPLPDAFQGGEAAVFRGRALAPGCARRDPHVHQSRSGTPLTKDS